ncbi:DNA-binding response regulator [Paenibacillus elgii]|uniref:DNA-binding response regulator n=1 Tax=Paenibacillus elgii TaxID=189691 RepID=A0A2T6G4K7_9BACL|nr:response regulator transcription factor [Paenibacillus elgii]PUA39099.1 DNA-binding response regulator [Paenibacillus elgii]
MKQESILLVDDERGILDILEMLLNKEGFRYIHKAKTGQEAIKAVQSTQFDLIVLDVMLPDIDGFRLCGQIRAITQAPILFLTARSGDLDMLTGFGIGGDDYISKPFNPLEVIARIRAHLRRQEAYRQGVSSERTVWDYGVLRIDKDEGRIVVNGQDVHPTAKEFELLIFFCSHPNRIFTASQLYERVWQEDFLGDDKTVVMHISRLRRKMEADPKNPEIIVNMRGIGYKFIPPGGRGQV